LSFGYFRSGKKLQQGEQIQLFLVPGGVLQKPMFQTFYGVGGQLPMSIVTHRFRTN
jgi:hypothetical protein